MFRATHFKEGNRVGSAQRHSPRKPRRRSQLKEIAGVLRMLSERGGGGEGTFANDTHSSHPLGAAFTSYAALS